MRYYRIEITAPGKLSPEQVYTSELNGKNDPGALNILFQARIVDQATPGENFWVKIQGVPIQSVAQANNLNGKNIKIDCGFMAGLPLANPKQSGTIVKGNILQCYGNWIANYTELNMFVTPGWLAATDEPATPKTGTMTDPIAVPFVWKAGQQLSDAMETYFSLAFPTWNAPNIAVSDKLVLPSQNFQSAWYRTLSAFNEWVQPFTQNLIGGNYGGVRVWVSNNTVYAWDEIQTPKTIQISFQDLIGQPVWLDIATMQFKCPMRADISIRNRVRMPKGTFPAIAGGQAPYNFRDKALQQGTFQVTEINHFGDFRNPNGEAWATVVTCAFLPEAA